MGAHQSSSNPPGKSGDFITKLSENDGNERLFTNRNKIRFVSEADENPEINDNSDFVNLNDLEENLLLQSMSKSHLGSGKSRRVSLWEHQSDRTLTPVHQRRLSNPEGAFCRKCRKRISGSGLEKNICLQCHNFGLKVMKLKFFTINT